MNVAGLSLLLASQFCLVLADLYAAIAHMEPLLETHWKVIEHLDSYIEREQKRIEKLKRSLDLYRKEHELAIADTTNYLGNPIRAFTLINRLTNGLYLIENSANASAVYVKEMSAIPGVSYPTEEDLTGSALAIDRVKHIYSLNITELVDEKHNGVGNPMSSFECYTLGRALYHQKMHNESLDWMKEALRRFAENGDEHITEVNILEYIAYALHMLGENKNALKVTRRILDLEPQNPRAASNLADFQKAITEKEVLKTTENQFIMYGRLCRGELDIARQVAKRLRCRYMHETHPFLRLAPLKQEQVYRQPDIYVFHQVMSDDEINQIRDVATPKFKRATIVDLGKRKEGANKTVAPYRTGKSAFLEDYELQPTLSRLSRRVQDMTGLDVTFAELLQVVDYGLGGHYGPHHDCAHGTGRHTAFAHGNRLATVLFYMSDVALGGATVFTALGLSVPPQKGSAVFWLNLNSAGEGDLAHQHGSCPVLRGSKLISTKWLHQEGQELIKPCGLEYQEEGIPWKIFPPMTNKVMM